MASLDVCYAQFGLTVPLLSPSKHACDTCFEVVTHQLRITALGRTIELETCGLCKKL